MIDPTYPILKTGLSIRWPVYRYPDFLTCKKMQSVSRRLCRMNSIFVIQNIQENIRDVHFGARIWLLTDRQRADK